ncbi:winged helix-turn-helix domain-containing protein [Pseudomonas sp. SCA2728.1_7]|uniref:ATP-binding protein n=1 Tax=Pseudomonas sp. SCA2728.1_7 TaxID=2825975 RepID=UPI001BAFA7AD|nr:winged helix-turn-helix domain-containing protein [Pseudomonas sp. SCA2728.1_7]QUE92248.1 helix-turn-helix transcriptional regulator [Pseudomonas sp. SCA2728.1_7]
MSLSPNQALGFGPYRIHPGQRRVLEGEQPLRLGRRAMDILLILLAHAGEVVSKQQLMAGVWPDSVVEDINLRVHMAALRKALGDGQAGQRYIITVAQRGYSFVAPVLPQSMEERPVGDVGGRHNLPLRRTRMIGRQPLVDSLMTQLPRQRCITLVGPGGIGKTTVALRVAEQLIGHYRDGIRLVDLAPLSDPRLICSHLAALLDQALLEGDPLVALVNGLQNRQMLLLLDNCEHLIDAVAALSESILRGAPRVHILATSRESLRAEGEFVQRLDSLEYPPMTATLNRKQALDFSALQLFIERATAAQESFELSDTQLPQAIEICHRLDGIPLALELAAAQVAELGLDGLLSQLQGRLPPLPAGNQNSLERHLTLRATLDWSFNLLDRCEQTCLRRLGVFRGGFTLESAAAVIVGQQIDPSMVFVSITQLVAKSMLSVEVGDEEVFYRLLDTTRRYALEKLEHAAECEETRERHAERCLALMQQAQNDWENTPTLLWIERYARGLEDLRAALDWCLNGVVPGGLGIRLTAASAPLWQELSLLKEYGAYVRRALSLFDELGEPCLRLKVALKLALGSACYHTWGGTAETIEAFVDARRLAHENDDVAGQLRAVSGHMAVNLSCGHYRMALAQSEHFDRLGLHGDPLLSLSTHRLRVLALHYAGDQPQARLHAEQVLQCMAQSGHVNRFTHGFGVQYDQSVASLTVLARVLWMQGLPEQAWRTARQALDIAVQIDHGTSICYTLALASCLIAHYNGDQQNARALLQLLLEQSQKHSVLLFNTWARHYAQVIDAQAKAPVPTDSSGLIREIMVTLDGRFVDDTLVERALSGDAGWSTAEILRARADTLLNGEMVCLGGPLREQARSHMDSEYTQNSCGSELAREEALPDVTNIQEAEALLQQSLTIARAQGALAWELRSATSLAQLWQRQSRYREALDLLSPIYQRFTEGYATPDLRKVRLLIDDLREHLHV